MDGMNHEQFRERIESAVVTFSDTGEVLELTTRKGRLCHFFERFRVGDDEVQFRLDWSDLDAGGKPMLDADFIDPTTGEHRALSGDLRDAHHTRSSPGAGRRYEWAFRGCSRDFTVVVQWQATVPVRGQAAVTVVDDVIRSADRSPGRR